MRSWYAGNNLYIPTVQELTRIGLAEAYRIQQELTLKVSGGARQSV
jgi:hypothetical protein